MILRKNNALFALLLLPLAFDFRGEAEGGIWQIAITVMTFAACAALVAAAGLFVPRSRLGKVAYASFAITVAGALSSFLLNVTPWATAARAAAPVLLAAAGFVVGVGSIMRERDAQLFGWLEVGYAVSVAFTLLTGFLLSGESAINIRYQILSPVMLMYQALLMHRIFVAKQRVHMAVVLLVATVAVELISATRSSIVGLLLVITAAAWIASNTVRGFLRTAVKGSSVLVVVGTLSIVVAGLVNPQIVDRWTDRILSYQQHGTDITSIARAAEIEDQLTQWGEDVTTLLIGKGYGASYGLAGGYASELGMVLGWDSSEFRSSAPGHNFFSYSLFAGGILFGTALPLLMIYATWRGVTDARRALRLRISERLKFNLSSSSLILVAAFGQMIGGNPFGPRYSGLAVGIALGVLVASHHLFAVVRSQHRAALSTL